MIAFVDGSVSVAANADQNEALKVDAVRQFIAAALVAAAVATPAVSFAADLADTHRAQTQIVKTSPRDCRDPKVLTVIGSKFRTQAKHVHHDPSLTIDTVVNPHEHRFEPAGDHRMIDRRYCNAVAVMSDGHQRQMWYLVEGGQGFASIGDGVTFCISGLDPWLVNSSACRVLR